MLTSTIKQNSTSVPARRNMKYPAIGNALTLAAIKQAFL
jgi:hypothetical protein